LLFKACVISFILTLWERLALSVRPILVGSTWRQRQNPVSETLRFK
jgi:hypothetical protein